MKKLKTFMIRLITWLNSYNSKRNMEKAEIDKGWYGTGYVLQGKFGYKYINAKNVFVLR
jgi:hypothetical protein